jgi:outer membrane protein OmpA-like peptidoglycan-associated protein
LTVATTPRDDGVILLGSHLQQGLVARMRSSPFSWCLTAALALAGLAAAPNASAQSLALDRFDPAPAGDRMFGVPSPFAAGSLTPHVMILGDYAHNPLVLRTLNSGNRVSTVVGNQLFLHLNGGVSLWNRLNVNLDVPLALATQGDQSSLVGPSFVAPNKAEFGDLRLGLRYRIWGEYFDPFQIAVGGYLWFPTGAKNAFVSDGTVRGLPQVIVGGRTSRLVYSAAVGPDIRKSQDVVNVGQGTMLKWGAGLGVLLLDNRHLQIGPELSGAITLRDVQKRSNNAELLLDLRYRATDDLEIAAGAGPGLTSGIGTPDVRVVFSVAYTPEPTQDKDGDGIVDREDACPDVRGIPDPDPHKNGCPPPADRDGDGIPDQVDACPDVRGVPDPDPRKHGCPPDRDGDGILDAEDACPDVKGVRTPDPRTNGCPPDRDGDGVIDAEDACPDVKGVRTQDPKTNGCPPDTDGDGIVDAEDACPDKPGPRNADPKKNGCPLVHVTETEVFILEQVQFDVDRATIKKVSDPLLDNVAAVLKDHLELARIEVQGHTDNTGKAAHNKQLSQARADAVMKALVKRGIDKKRLTAKGYGQDKPIADNATAEGKQKNRRVQFVILEKKAKGAK